MCTARYRIIYCLFLIAVCFITAKIGFAGEILATVKLIPEANVANSVVRLGDISTVESDDKQLKSQIEAVRIWTFNKPGESKVIGAAHISARLQRARLNPKLLSFKGNQVKIVSKATTIRADEILNKVRKYLFQHIPHNKGNIEVKPTSPIKPVTLPDGDVKIEISPLAKSISRGRLEAKFFVNGKLCDKQRLSVKVYATYNVVVAQRNIPKNTLINQKYLKLEERKLSEADFGAMTEISEVVGKIAKKSIAKSRIITEDMLKSLPLVARDDTITLVVYSKLLRIRTKGIALQEGAHGQIIRIKNLNSERILVGEVIGPRLVRVYVGTKKRVF